MSRLLFGLVVTASLILLPNGSAQLSTATINGAVTDEQGPASLARR